MSEIYNYIDKKKLSVVLETIENAHGLPNECYLEGKYNDLLKPNIHYFCLKRDYSNFDEVIELIKDEKKVKRISNDAYDHVLSNHLYEHRINHIIDCIK